MPRQAKTDGENRFKRYRENKRRQGLRQVRLWVWDTRAPGFAEEAKRQAALLRGAPEEAEALDFIEKAMDWGDER
ncbi:MAG TPA: antitoxin MazE family protein [Xanthobacteraceae bacterium]|nr:antitoxin MazE family protein [Xanthobacteraceae bacterium]